MTHRDNTLGILRYGNFDNLPVVSFGFWGETVQKWAAEGHLPQEEADGYCRYGDASPADRAIMDRLGFDFNWNHCVEARDRLLTGFPREVLEKRSDGSLVVRNSDGLIVLEKPGVVSIPGEIGTTLVDRAAWEEHYLPRLQWDESRIDRNRLEALKDDTDRPSPIALHCGSLMGYMRNLLGVEQLSYLYADDEDLYVEIVDTIANLSYRCVEELLKSGAKFDYAHFWEDICFKNGPLVIPSVFEECVGPHYRKITELVGSYGLDIVSLDCDGCIDQLVPIWLKNGVNTMFPIEVGTWDGNIAPWRAKYGRALRGVGGMNKTVFSRDFKAVDEEIERLKPLIALGGYIPCPDHRIAPDAKFDNVRYYCEKMHELKI